MNRFLSVDSIDDLTQVAAAAACQALQADHGVLYLLDEANERLVSPRGGLTLPVEGPGFAPWCVFNRQTLLVNEAQEDERRNPEHNGTQVAAATPLLADGRIIGALEVGRNSPSPFTAEDETVFRDLAQEVGVAMVAAQLRDDLKNLLLHTGEWMVAAQERVAPGGPGHVWRTSQLCLDLAEELAFSTTDRHRIWLAARYHDLGWVLQGTEETHAVVGARELRTVRRLESIADLVELHHERFDGSGRPNGVAGADMSLEACILSLAEDFDETTTAHKLQIGFASQGDLTDYVTSFVQKFGSRHHPRVMTALEALVGVGKLRVLYL